MKTKDQRYNELYSNGLVNSVKNLFKNRNDISEDYYVLMADYIDSMDQIKDQMLINPTEIARRMPELVESIQETNLGGIYGRTDDNRIQMEQSLSYQDKKLYFFHELTHALQTSHENGREQCGFYNGHDGMFLTEGATQYTAELLYNVSNGTDMQHRQQPRTVRGASDRNPNSPLSEYQYNGDVLELMAKSMDLPLPQVLALAYKKDGREKLKSIYESMEGNQGKFDELMNNLEQIYSIDKLIIYGNSKYLQSPTPQLFTMANDDHTPFRANFDTYHKLMDKTERELAETYLKNHDTQYILQNYDEIASLLTTPELRNNFLATVHELSQEVSQNRDNVDLKSRPELQSNEISLKQKVARFLQKNNLFMNLSFVENFVHKQLDVLPESTQEQKTAIDSLREQKQAFDDYITGNGEYQKLPPIQRMSDPQKLQDMQRKMGQVEKDDNGMDR